MTDCSDIPKGYQKTESGGLPEDWKIVKFESAAHIIMGQSPPGTTYNETGDGKPFLQGKAEFGEVNPKNIKFTTDPKKIAPLNSILMSVRAPVGDVNIADIEYCIGRGLAAISLEKGDNRFLFFLLQHLKDEIEKEGTGSIFKSINKAKLSGIEIPLPPLPEQHAIVHVLRTVQEAKEKTDAVIAATKALKASMMKHLFTYGPVPREKAETVALNEEGSLRYPEHWNLGRFDNFIVLQRGFDITKDEQRDGNVPVISSSGIKSYHNTPRVKGPGVTIGRKGTLGKVFYVDCDYWPHDTSLWVKDFKGNNPKFVYYLLTTLNLKILDTGTSNPTLNRNYVHALKIALPSLKEQGVIVDILSTIDQKIAAEQSRKEALDTLFTSLLHDLMTAKIRVAPAETA